MVVNCAMTYVHYLQALNLCRDPNVDVNSVVVMTPGSNSVQLQTNSKQSPSQASSSEKENPSLSASSKTNFPKIESGTDSVNSQGKVYVMLYSSMLQNYILLFHFGRSFSKTTLCF